MGKVCHKENTRYLTFIVYTFCPVLFVLASPASYHPRPICRLHSACGGISSQCHLSGWYRPCADPVHPGTVHARASCRGPCYHRGCDRTSSPSPEVQRRPQQRYLKDLVLCRTPIKCSETSICGLHLFLYAHVYVHSPFLWNPGHFRRSHE